MSIVGVRIDGCPAAPSSEASVGLRVDRALLHHDAHSWDKKKKNSNDNKK